MNCEEILHTQARIVCVLCTYRKLSALFMLCAVVSRLRFVGFGGILGEPHLPLDNSWPNFDFVLYVNVAVCNERQCNLSIDIFNWWWCWVIIEFVVSVSAVPHIALHYQYISSYSHRLLITIFPKNAHWKLGWSQPMLTRLAIPACDNYPIVSAIHMFHVLCGQRTIIPDLQPTNARTWAIPWLISVDIYLV